MLAYLDQPLETLGRAERIALAGLRLWARAAIDGDCATPALRVLCDRFGARELLWPAHNFFYWTFVHATRPIQRGCPSCGRVGDDEAALLTAMCALDDRSRYAALAPLLVPIALDRGLYLARTLQRELACTLDADAGRANWA